MGQSDFLLFIFLLFNNEFYRKVVDFCGTQTWIVGVEGEHACPLTTPTAQDQSNLESSLIRNIVRESPEAKQWYSNHGPLEPEANALPAVLPKLSNT